MTFQKIRYALDGDVAVITLADPETLNAASIEMVGEVRAALVRAAEQARCVLLTGEGRGFCSGANLAAGMPEDGIEAMLADHYNPLILDLRDLPVPLVTAVNGAAAGMGCMFALMGDLIVAAESAYFLQAFRRIGLVPDGGSTYLLSRMIGRARAMEMMMLGEKIPAAQALAWGMINRCAPDENLMPAAMEIAERLASGPRSLSMIRNAAWAGLEADLRTQLSLEARLQAEAGSTQDFIEGVSAFIQKRPAKFSGA
ncbi:MAG TPA: enoyl-CoA hydratase/isomerase [Caulobacterales bacterium]|nr:enoyl-CoA hydratase/isomerase [Caulobacterales bacterium]